MLLPQMNPRTALDRSACVLHRVGYTMRAFLNSYPAGEQVAFEGVDRCRGRSAFVRENCPHEFSATQMKKLRLRRVVSHGPFSWKHETSILTGRSFTTGPGQSLMSSTLSQIGWLESLTKLVPDSWLLKNNTY